MRNTEQKTLILNIINGSTSHPKVEEIYTEAKKVIPSISLGTIYRNLNSLVAAGLIIRLNIDDVARYDNLNYIHDHFHCYKCLTIIDVFDRANMDHSKIGGHEVHDCSIIYKGICAKCLREGK
jgi:Fe2+/Zn2+ uptake regulation proteins